MRAATIRRRRRGFQALEKYGSAASKPWKPPRAAPEPPRREAAP
jgi:hypothetical protein